MAKLKSVTLSGTTAADGTLTVNADLPVQGYLHSVEWVVGTFATGVDAVISVQNPPSGVALTLLTLTNADANAVYYPRYVVHSEAGAALTGTSGGDRTRAYIDGKLRLAVTSGGNAKTGSVLVYYEV